MNGRQLPKVSVDIKTISVRPVFRSRRTYAYYPFFIHCLVSEVLGILDTHRSIFGLYGRAIMCTFDYYMLYVRYRYHTHRKLFGLYGMAIMRTLHKDQNLFIFVQLWQNGQKRKIFENCLIIYSKIIIFWCKNSWKINFFIIFLDWHKIMGFFDQKDNRAPPLPLHFCKKYLYERIDLET